MQRNLAKTYTLVPSVKNIPHLEIASIFLSHSSEKFLKPNGKIGFVLPRSFMSADQHKNFRSGESAGFKLTSVWDLADVIPLFRVPAMVAFAEKCEVKTERKFPKMGISGYILSGRMNREDKAQGGLWGDMSGKINKIETIWYNSKLGERTALSNKKTSLGADKNFYEPYFKQGATIVPRNFYFVDLQGVLPTDKKDSIVVVKTAEHILDDAKPPWKDFILKNQINTNFIFRTAIAKSILPFQLVNPVLVALPIEIETIGKKKQIKLLDSEKIASSGDFRSAEYFRKAETLWEKHRTEKNKRIAISNYLNWQNKLSDQNLNMRYIVLYNASAKDANAVVVNRKQFDFEFIVESAAYSYMTDNQNEAIYLCTFLNSNYANEKIKSFQATGLFGERHVHKAILQIPLPEYTERNPLHEELMQIGTACIEKTKNFLKPQDVSEVSGIKLGNLRLKIKENLVKELKEIDKLLRKINKE